MNDSEKAELMNAIKELQRKVESLSAPLEDALAYRVFQKSHDQLKKWFLLWIGILSVAVVVLGYKSYQEISDTAKNAVKQYLAQKGITEIKKELMLQVVNKIDKQSSETEEKLEKVQNVIAVSENVNPTTLPVMATKSSVSGYVFYGITKDGGGWDEQNFKMASGNNSSFPKADDIIIATVPVTIREGLIQYSEAKGWYNRKSKGILKPDSKAKVLEVIHVPDNPEFIWIRLVKL